MPPADTAATHVIVKYSNRRIYSRLTAQYITIDKFGEFVDRGDRIRVENFKDGQDLTEVLLLQLLQQRVQSGKLTLSVPSLVSLIRQRAA